MKSVYMMSGIFSDVPLFSLSLCSGFASIEICVIVFVSIIVGVSLRV